MKIFELDFFLSKNKICILILSYSYRTFHLRKPAHLQNIQANKCTGMIPRYYYTQRQHCSHVSLRNTRQHLKKEYLLVFCGRTAKPCGLVCSTLRYFHHLH